MAFSINLQLISNYLSNRQQRVKLGPTSGWLDTKHGIPKGAVLVPLSYIVFSNDFLLAIQNGEISSLVDDNAVYKIGKDLQHVVMSLEVEAQNSINLFASNEIAEGQSIFQVMILGMSGSETAVSLRINDGQAKSIQTVKLPGVTIDSKLQLVQHVRSVNKTANKKLTALCRISNSIDENHITNE